MTLSRIAVALLILTVSACGDNFAAVQEADTIEAYEEYLANNPDGTFALQASARLEELYLDQAKANGDLALYDKYLERFPEGALRERAIQEREEFLYNWARSENTEASWSKYIEEYPKGNPKNRKFAKKMLEVAKNSKALTITSPNVEQINLAEDPEGPLNGWAFSVDVTNNGDKAIETLFLTMDYLDDQGRRIDSRSYPVVTPYFKVPMESFRYKPLKPGQTVPWNFSSGDTPERWSRQIRVYPTSLKFVAEE